MVTKSGGGPVLGLDIGTSTIKAVEVRPGRRPQVTAVGITPTPPDTFAGDIIVDPPALGHLIKKLLQESGISAKRVVSAVSGQTSFAMRLIPLPKMTPKELKDTMKFEVERQVPFPSSEVVMDFKPLVRPDDPPDAPEMNVLLVVGQQQMIDAHVETLLAAGLEPTAIDVEPLAAIRSLLDDSFLNQTVALINLGATKTDLAIFERGMLAFPRPIPVAGEAFTQAIAAALGRSREDAEALKKDVGEVSLDVVPMASPFGGVDAGGGGDFSFFDTGGAPLGDAEPEPAAQPDPGAFSPAAEGPILADAGDAPRPASVFSLEEEPPAAPGPAPSAFALDEDLSLEPAPATSAFALDDEPASFAFSGSTSTSEPQPLAGEPDSAAELPSSGPMDFSDFMLEPAAGGAEAAPPQSPPDDHALAQLSEPERLRRQVSEAIAPVVGDLVTEIRRSLEYFRSRSAEGVIHRIYLCGGTARLKNLDRFLERELGAPVQVLEPSQRMDASGRYANARYLAEVSPLLAVGVGLGLRDVVDYGPAVRSVPKSAPKRERKPKRTKEG